MPEIYAVREWLADNKVLDPEGPGEMFEALSRRKPLLSRLRPLRREDGTVSPKAAVIVGGLAVGAALLALSTVKARKK